MIADRWEEIICDECLRLQEEVLWQCSVCEDAVCWPCREGHEGHCLDLVAASSPITRLMASISTKMEKMRLPPAWYGVRWGQPSG